jgi:hypothetical protein
MGSAHVCASLLLEVDCVCVCACCFLLYMYDVFVCLLVYVSVFNFSFPCAKQGFVTVQAAVAEWGGRGEKQAGNLL